MPIETRPATADDAAFLAWVMQEAARSHLEQGIWDFAFPGEDEPRLEILAKIITTERIHFAHFSRFRVLAIDGEPASALAAYENAAPASPRRAIPTRTASGSSSGSRRGRSSGAAP
jgi:hypothetical protein